MKRDDVYKLCKVEAPKHGFDPILILALCEQESVNPKDPLEYREWICRPEAGYYNKYVEKVYKLATTTEVLFSNSWGLSQMMGDSLYQAGFFEWYFADQTKKYQDAYGNDPLHEIAVIKALNAYAEHPEWQVEYGCKWLKRKMGENPDVDRGLRLYNGSKEYPPKVRKRERKLRAIYGT